MKEKLRRLSYLMQASKGLKGSYIFVAAMLISSFASAQTYCTGGPSSTADSEITNVALTGDNYSISNLLTCPGATGVQDFTATDSADVSQGTSYTLNITFGTCGGVYSGYGRAWADWNDDGDFDDAGEELGSWSGSAASSGTTTYNANFSFTVPTGATLGQTRMRIMQRESGSATTTTPCATFTWGAIEDYTLNVTNTPPPCPTPGSVSSVPGATTAVINWVGTGTAYDIEYGPTGFVQGSGTTTTSTLATVSLTGLTANTGYDVYVRNNCTLSSNGTSAWTIVHTFYTTCTSISTFPYLENFDGTTWVASANFSTSGDAIDQCWDRLPTSYAPMAWLCHTGTTGSGSTGPGSAYSGSNYMYTEQSSGVTGSFAYLTLPAFDLSSLTSPLFSYYYHRYGAAMGNLDVEVSLDTGATWTSVFTKTGAQQSANSDPWAEELIDLTNYKSAHTLVRFRATKGSSFTSDMAIDDVRMQEAPPCPKPTALSVGTITSSSAVVSWLSSGVEFVVEYGPSGYTQGTGMLDTVTTGSVTLTGLAGNTTYDVYVLNNCTAAGNGVSAWAGPVTFTTLCTALSTPLDEGFETTSTGTTSNLTVPDCWFYQRTATAPFAYVINFSGYPRTGTNCYRFYSSSLQTNGDTSMLISPEIDGMDVTDKRIEFWARSYSTSTAYDCELVVGTVANPGDVGSFVPLDTFNIGNNTTYQYFQTYFDAANGYNGTHRYIAIMDNSDNFDYTVVDDITISNVPACTPSSALTVGNITNNTAVASWTAGDGLSYQVEYGPTGFTQGTGPVVTGITSTNLAISGLNSNTCYDIYVRDSCAGSISPWFGPITFCTLCDPQAVPYTENFDNASTGNTIDPSMPDCWFYYENPTHIGYGYTYSFLTPNSAPNHFRMYNSSSLADTLAIISPAIQGMNNGDLLVKFFAKSNTTSYETDLIVGTMGSPDDPSSLNILDTVQAPQAYTEFTVYLDTASGYNGTDQHVVFMHGNGATFRSVYIDDISIEQIPSCTAPWNLAVNNITSSGASISWATLQGTCFKVEYGPTGFVQGTGNGTVISNTTSPTAITGLNPATVYDVYIADCCDSTNWAGPITFQSLCLSQLNGTYTVGSPTANFATLDSAMATLTGCGMSGPVTFSLQGGTHAIGGQLISGITGLSSTNTVTIAGSGPGMDTILINSGSVGFDFDGAGNFTFQNLTVNGSANGRTFWLHNGASNISFDNCHLWNNPAATSSATGVIVGSGSATSNFTAGDNCSNISVTNCKLVGGYVGIIIYGIGTTAYTSGYTVENNDFNDQSTYGMRFYYTEDVSVKENIMTGPTPNYGLYGYYWNDIAVERNQLQGTTGAMYSGYVNVYRNDTPSVRSVIRNNFFVGSGTYASYNYAARHLDYVHNSVQGNGTYGGYFSATTSTALPSFDVNMNNNIFVGGSNYALYAFASNYQELNSDYNIFFTGGSNLAYWNGARSDLSALQSADTANNQNSLSGDPGFISTADLHVVGTLPNDAGDNGWATDDIDGDTRPASGSTTVDIGADEYTPLQDDASMEGLLVKLAGCGDSITEVSAIVKNFGLTTITSLPITVNVSGGITATLNVTSTTSLASGATDTVLVGDINTYDGAVGVMFEGYTSLVGDQKTSNDTMMVGPGNYVPVEPQYYAEDTVCASVDSATFAALAIPGIQYGWYANPTDSTPVAVGDSFTFPLSGQQTWYLAYEESADSLETYFLGGNGQAGNAFDVLPTSNISIQGLTMNVQTAGAVSVNIYYRAGTYVGFNTNLTGWTLHETVSATSAGTGNRTPVPFTNALTLPGGSITGMMVVLTSGSVAYTNGALQGAVLASNSDLIIYEGSGISWPLGSNFTPRNFNGVIHYGSSGCSGIKQSLTIGIDNDTAVASAFTATVQTNGADVDFDGSSSNGDVYDWTFGDGNLGSGALTSHTYATAGLYTACLVVTDTSCGTTDTVCQDVLATIGLEESLINQTMNVYPNPNNGDFRVEFQVEGLKNVELRVVTLLGQVVYESKPGNVSGTYREEIKLGDEATGVYILQLVTEDGTISRRVTVRK